MNAAPIRFEEEPDFYGENSTIIQSEPIRPFPYVLPERKSNNKLIILVVIFLLFNTVIFVYWKHKFDHLIQSTGVIPVTAVDVEQATKMMQEELTSTNARIQRYEQEMATIQLQLQRAKADIKTITQTIGIQTNSLPLILPYMNENNQRIEDILYPDEGANQTKQTRVNFKNQRVAFINSISRDYPFLHLAQHNLILNETDAMQAKQDFQLDWIRLEEKFHLSQVTTELPMCLLVCGYNNNARFRIEHNLNSIFTQNYTNYKVVIINDASNDGSGDVYRKYLQFYKIDKSKYIYIQNQKRVTALQNLYHATLNNCSKDSIAVTLDADDEFIGRNALKVFNWGYQTKKSGVLYSNFYWYEQPQASKVRTGFTTQYTDEQKRDRQYRDIKMRFSHLRSYRTQLFYKINPQDLKDEDGNFYTIAYDMAIFLPLMELACGRVNKVDGEFHYLYNIGTGLNDYNDRARQDRIDKKIRAMKKYDCDVEFEDKMKALP